MYCDLFIVILHFVFYIIDMSYDVRFGKYVFKHVSTETPSTDTASFPEHYHSLYELLFFIKGDADFAIESKRYSLKPGDLLVVKPGEHHNVILKSQSPYERVVIRFDAVDIRPQLRQYLQDLESVYYIKHTPVSYEINNIDNHYEKIRNEIIIPTFISSLNIILSYLCSSPELIQKADSIQQDVKEIVDYIDSHLPDIHSIDDLSKNLHMSKSLLYKTFAKHFDTPLMSYVRTRKMMLARVLLTEGVPATEVSERLGFSHYSSFYRDYQSIFKESPSGK